MILKPGKQKIFNSVICILLTLAMFISFSTSQEAYAQTTTTSTYNCSDVDEFDPDGQFLSRVCNLAECPRRKFNLYFELTTCTVTIKTPKKKEIVPSF